MVLVVSSLCHATPSVTMAWDPNPEPDIARYKVYYGTQSGNPDQSFEAGNVTSTTVVDLADATEYFFTVTAINTAGLESSPSNEVSYKTASPAARTLTVNNGTGGGSYVAGTIVKVQANAAPTGKQFAGWTDDWQILSNPFIETTTATMPSLDVTVTANYSPLPTYTLAVNNGSGGGSYLAGTEVSITANAAPSGQQFSNWSGSIRPADPLSPTTTVTMLSVDAEISANYSPLPTYTLTVNSGTGSGSYPAGTEVTVTANAAPSGQQFAAWTGNVSFANAASPTTTLIMPSNSATVSATYKVSDRIRYYPRSGYASRMVGGIFEGTNDPAGGYTQIYQITSTPPAAWTALNVNLGNYRYLRYRSPNGSYGNVAEIEFYRGGVKLKGTGYGTTGSWRNRGNTFQKALDSNTGTYFDAPTANGNYVGIITQ
ncbi:MAG TPA: fibronectin type III domain-containing protein [Terrimicrobiaceae bacterium]|nr:fibronectin type III domain-containing protein [Terrimicrobiaceae bacterium]